jgi:6-phosphofructokinase 1
LKSPRPVVKTPHLADDAQDGTNMAKGNVLVGQSGGPTAVINASLMGIVDAASASKSVGEVLGMRFGIEGVLEERLVDLKGQSAATKKALRATPSSALGSSRLKLTDERFEPILKTLKKFDIRYFFMIGGNDTMDTIRRVVEYARDNGHEMAGVGVCKTVDNDLPGTDHTPGFPSAARYAAMSVLQGGILARDMQRVDKFTIFQTVGRSAGWLPAATACAKREEADAPHVILLPERPFDRAAFLSAVASAEKKYGFASIVCGEGIVDAEGRPVSASETRDKFDNVVFGAMGGTSAAMMLHRMISDEFGWRGEFQITESLLMAAGDRATKLDLDEAYGCGREAVRLAESGESGVMVTIERLSKPGEPYKCGFGSIPLAKVALHDRPMPGKFIAKNGMGVTKAFLDYAGPLVGELPSYASLELKFAKPAPKKTAKA